MVRSTEVTAVMQKFVAQINAHDPFGMMSLCTVDHVFIDSLGSRVSGRERLQQAWTGYFALFPNYHIELESAASQGTLALALRFRLRHSQGIAKELAYSSSMAHHRERWASFRVAGLR